MELSLGLTGRRANFDGTVSQTWLPLNDNVHIDQADQTSLTIVPSGQVDGERHLWLYVMHYDSPVPPLFTVLVCMSKLTFNVP